MPAVQARSHAQRVSGGATPGVDGQADEIAIDQFAELAAELEPRLIASLIRRRCSPDRCQEFAAARDFIADGGNVMTPAATAQKAQMAFAVIVLAQRIDQMAAQRGFRTQRRRQRNGSLSQVIGGNLFEQFRDAGGADRVQHLLLDRAHGIGHEGMRLWSHSHCSGDARTNFILRTFVCMAHNIARSI